MEGSVAADSADRYIATGQLQALGVEKVVHLIMPAWRHDNVDQMLVRFRNLVGTHMHAQGDVPVLSFTGVLECQIGSIRRVLSKSVELGTLQRCHWHAWIGDAGPTVNNCCSGTHKH